MEGGLLPGKPLTSIGKVSPALCAARAGAEICSLEDARGTGVLTVQDLCWILQQETFLSAQPHSSILEELGGFNKKY